MASSPWRRATSIRAASRITAAPTTTRLTNRSRSTVSTAAWVPRNRARSCSSGELTVSASAAGASAPVSVGVTAVARFSALYSPCTWSAFMPPTSSGNSSCSARPVPPNAPWIAPNWSGSAMTPPTQKSGELGLTCSSAGFTGVASCRQKVEPACAWPHDGGDEQRDRAGRGGQRQAAARVHPEPRGRLRGGGHAHRAGRNAAAAERARHQPRIAGERGAVGDLQLGRRPGLGAGPPRRPRRGSASWSGWPSRRPRAGAASPAGRSRRR